MKKVAQVVVVLAIAAATVVACSPAVSAQTYQTPWSEGDSRPTDLVIRLVTFSPGDDVTQWFGHTGLVVEDTRHNVSSLYNYGMFSFDEKFAVRFAMGRLWFWVAPTSVSRSFQQYIERDRDVRVVELNLPAEKRLEVAEFLAENVQPENREYLYHHYDDNCSTRVRDVIDMALDGKFSERYKNEPGRMTLREHTRRHAAHIPPMDWLLMFLMNNSIDEPTTVWDEMFLPRELERRVVEFDWEDEQGETQRLALRKHVVYEAEDRQSPPEEPPMHWPWWLLLGLAIGAVGVAVGWTSRRRPGRGSRIRYGVYHLLVGLAVGLPGLVLGLMAGLTEHDVTYWNQNLLWANPLTFVVAFLAVWVLRGSSRARRGLVMLWVVLGGLAAVGVLINVAGIWVSELYQKTHSPMALLLPIVVGSVVCAWMVDGRKLPGVTSEPTEETGEDEP